jgi:hypothetical protein
VNAATTPTDNRNTSEPPTYSARPLESSSKRSKTCSFDEKGVKPVLSFVGKQKKLVVNATNFDVLAAGISNNTTKWVGHAIVLKGVKVKFKGSLVDSIQVEVAAPLKRSESKSDPDFDDDLPDNLVA